MRSESDPAKINDRRYYLKHREQILAKQREYYRLNRQRILERDKIRNARPLSPDELRAKRKRLAANARLYRLRHREAFNARQREIYRRTAERCRERSQEYRLRNPDKIREYSNRYYRLNWQRLREYNKQRRAALITADGIRITLKAQLVWIQGNGLKQIGEHARTDAWFQARGLFRHGRENGWVENVSLVIGVGAPSLQRNANPTILFRYVKVVLIPWKICVFHASHVILASLAPICLYGTER